MDLLTKVKKLEEAAEEFGLRWENPGQIMAQIQSECGEINEHLSQEVDIACQAELQEEIGDLLHAVFSLCLFCKLDPKDTLKKTLNKFENRLNAVKKITQEHGLNNLDGLSFDELMHVWEKAKKLTNKF